MTHGSARATEVESQGEAALLARGVAEASLFAGVVAEASLFARVVGVRASLFARVVGAEVAPARGLEAGTAAGIGLR